MNRARLLVVDDHATNLDLTKDALELYGFSVLTAESGTRAIALVESSRPTVVILDIQMPAPGGLEVLRRIRRSDDPKIAGTRVIAATALVTDADRDACFAAGADVYLSRPFRFSALVQHICALTEGLCTD